MSGELKPCPFCGNENPAILERTCDKHTPYNPNDRAYPVVRCRECGCEKPGLDWSGPETAVRNWNNRAALAKRDSVNRFVPCNEERACANCYSGQGECIAKREAVADVRVTTTVDAIDAHSHQFVCDLATAVGALRGRIESWPHDGCGHVEVLWDGPNVSALAVTLRDMLNRTKCVMVNLAPLLAASQQAAKPAPVPEENVMVWLAGDPEAGPAQ